MFNVTNLAETRRYAAAQAARLGLSADRTNDLRSAVAELANNSVMHGGGRGILEIWSSDGYVVCQVRDAGTIADPLAGRRPVSTAWGTATGSTLSTGSGVGGSWARSLSARSSSKSNRDPPVRFVVSGTTSAGQ